MTTTGTLTDFLLARIAEDERAALREIERREAEVLATASAFGQAFLVVGYALDPARVLLEVMTKRQIVALHSVITEQVHINVGEQVHRETEYQCEVCGWFPPGAACDTLRILVAVYANHPDYQQEWHVDGLCANPDCGQSRDHGGVCHA